jgi:hypothetical protein
MLSLTEREKGGRKGEKTNFFLFCFLDLVAKWRDKALWGGGKVEPHCV